MFFGNIALQGVIEASVELEAFVKKEKNKKFTGVMNKKDKKKRFQLGVGIEANSFVSLTLGKDFGINNDFTSDFYFSGVTIFVKFQGGRKKKKKASTFDIVPDLNKSFDILKNKGEFK